MAWVKRPTPVGGMGKKAHTCWRDQGTESPQLRSPLLVGSYDVMQGGRQRSQFFSHKSSRAPGPHGEV